MTRNKAGNFEQKVTEATEGVAGMWSGPGGRGENQAGGMNHGGTEARSRDPRRGLMKKETPHARASLLAAVDEGVHRNARGGRGPQFLKRHRGTEEGRNERGIF
jgi:hypothetical protein